jgi:integrase
LGKLLNHRTPKPRKQAHLRRSVWVKDNPVCWTRFGNRIRHKHYSIRAEQARWTGSARFVLHHNKRHPRDMGAAEVEGFLARLAVAMQLSALDAEPGQECGPFPLQGSPSLPWLEGIESAKRPARLPVVLTREEVESSLAHLSGTVGLMIRLLYGTGMRIIECVRLRVKDVDFARGEIVVQQDKGARDRMTMLPQSLAVPLRSPR